MTRINRLNLALQLTIFLVLEAGLILETSPGAAQSSPALQLNDQIKRVENAIEEGQKKKHVLDRTESDLRAELLRLRQEKVRIATTIRNTETHIFALERQMKKLNSQETKQISELSRRRDQFGQVLIALQRLSRVPPEAVLAYPAPSSDLVRTAILLRTAIPKIEARAQRLRENLTTLELTRDAIKLRKMDLQQATARLENRQRELDQLDSTKSHARRKTLAARQIEAARLDRLTEEAQTLRELFDRLEQERVERARNARPPAAGQYPAALDNTQPRRLEPPDALTTLPPFEIDPITAARGKLTYPVIGAVTGKYDGLLSKGQRRKGLAIETQPGVQVVAPFNGQIVFSGPFRRYGHLLIIEHGEGYHSLLAGMALVEGTVGQWLLAGEPVGSMARSQSGKPSIYMELRRNGQPVNPNLWLATEKGKTNG